MNTRMKRDKNAYETGMERGLCSKILLNAKLDGLTPIRNIKYGEANERYNAEFEKLF